MAISPSRTHGFIRSGALCLLLVSACAQRQLASGDGPDGGVVEGGARISATCVHPPVVPRCHDDYCLIPPGCYLMGSPHDEPFRARTAEELREISFSHWTLLGQHEVTQQEWTQAGMPNRAGTRKVQGGTDCTAPDCPAAEMNWLEAMEFVNRKSKAESKPSCIELTSCHGTLGADYDCDDFRQTTTSYYDCTGYRLPTAAEFQYASRAGTTTPFYSGPFTPAQDACYVIPHLAGAAWYCANSGYNTHPVMQKAPNGWGLFDMVGNAGEWHSDQVPIDTRGLRSETDPNRVLPRDKALWGGWGGMTLSGFTATPRSLRAAEIDEQNHGWKATGGGLRLIRSISAIEAAAW